MRGGVVYVHQARYVEFDPDSQRWRPRLCWSCREASERSTGLVALLREGDVSGDG